MNTNGGGGEGLITAKGTCKEGYKSVRALFESHLRTGKDENAQLCVYVEGERVIDLWGSSIGDTKYGPDDLQASLSHPFDSLLVAK